MTDWAGAMGTIDYAKANPPPEMTFKEWEALKTQFSSYASSIEPVGDDTVFSIKDKDGFVVIQMQGRVNEKGNVTLRTINSDMEEGEFLRTMSVSPLQSKLKIDGVIPFREGDASAQTNETYEQRMDRARDAFLAPVAQGELSDSLHPLPQNLTRNTGRTV